MSTQRYAKNRRTQYESVRGFGVKGAKHFIAMLYQVINFGRAVVISNYNYGYLSIHRYYRANFSLLDFIDILLQTQVQSHRTA